MYQIKADEMPFRIQKKYLYFAKWVCIGRTLNVGISSNLGEILREFGEILGKYRILDDSSLGSKGLSFWGNYFLPTCTGLSVE